LGSEPSSLEWHPGWFTLNEVCGTLAGLEQTRKAVSGGSVSAVRDKVSQCGGYGSPHPEIAVGFYRSLPVAGCFTLSRQERLPPAGDNHSWRTLVRRYYQRCDDLAFFVLACYRIAAKNLDAIQSAQGWLI